MEASVTLKYAVKKILMRVICEYETEREFVCLLHVERKEDNKITVSVYIVGKFPG